MAYLKNILSYLGLKALILKIVTLRIFIPIISKHVKKSLLFECLDNKHSDSFGVLVLHSHRWTLDLDVLKRSPKLKLISLDATKQQWLNNLFLNPVLELFREDRRLYFHPEANPKALKYTNKLSRYLTDFIKYFAEECDFKCIVTCNFRYVPDIEWAKASRLAGVPFIALHKECMRDESTEQFYIDLYKDRNLKFYGNKLVVYNEREKKIIVESNICEEKNIIVAGCLRIDDIIKECDHVNNRKKAVCLFSFRHFAAGIKVESRTGFDDHEGEGLVEAFAQTHEAIAELAIEYPDIVFIIKPKWLSSWEEKIREVIRDGVGREIEDIKNLILTVDIDAQTLIKKSTVVIGLNSTTLLESRILKKTTIIPMFAEAGCKYKDKIWFQKYSGSEFIFPTSKEEFKEQVVLAVQNDNRQPPSHELIDDYLGFHDGKTLERIVSILETEVSMASPELVAS